MPVNSRNTLAISFAAIVATLMNDPMQAADANPQTAPISKATLGEIRALYRELIDAENRHDIAAVRRFVWDSPNALFVAKTATAAEGNWAGFWGTEVVMKHLGEIYEAGSFRIDPDYDRERVVGLTCDVAESYVPVNITVAYAGQTPVPRPFLMILTWIHTPEGWRMATDIALPIPPVPQP